jgi:hypothetical protein
MALAHWTGDARLDPTISAQANPVSLKCPQYGLSGPLAGVRVALAGCGFDGLGQTCRRAEGQSLREAVN